ncbi:MAG TPA: GerMN domain-containing protein [Acidobacteriota bacterium]|nr:GerMN domain-containing protein [Acidobacteriota bacterium]
MRRVKQMHRRRRWVAGIAAALALIALWYWIGRGPAGRGKSPGERFVPLAAELEGIRGVTLYYGVPGTDSLAAEYRDVVVKDRQADQVRAVFRELVAGPAGQHAALFPDGTELLNAYLSPRGTLYLDWNRGLVQGFRGGSGRERLLLASIVRTAADNFPDVERVTLLVDGNPVETVGGHFDALAPLVVGEWQ